MRAAAEQWSLRSLRGAEPNHSQARGSRSTPDDASRSPPATCLLAEVDQLHQPWPEFGKSHVIVGLVEKLQDSVIAVRSWAGDDINLGGPPTPGLPDGLWTPFLWGAGTVGMDLDDCGVDPDGFGVEVYGPFLG